MRSRLLAVAVALALSGAAAAQNAASTQAALTNTPVKLKQAPGRVVSVYCANPNAAVTWLQFFDSTGTVTPGTTPPKFSVPVPASVAINALLGVSMFAGIEVFAATTATGGSAPGTAIPCTVLFQ